MLLCRELFANVGDRLSNTIFRAKAFAQMRSGLAHGLVVNDVQQRSRETVYIEGVAWNGARPNAQRMDATCPEGLVGKVGHANRRHASLQPRGCCASATVVNQCRHAREEPVVRHLIHQKNGVGHVVGLQSCPSTR